MQNEGQDEFNMHRWMYLCVCVCVRVFSTAIEYLEIKNVGYKLNLEIYLFIYLLTGIEAI